jgi:hypothetical protein
LPVAAPAVTLSIQACPQVAGAGGDHQDADLAADQDIGNVRHDPAATRGTAIRSLEGAKASLKPAAGRYAPPRTCQGSLRDPYGQTLDRTSPAQIPVAIGFGGGVVGRQNHVSLRSHRRGRPAMHRGRQDQTRGRAARCTLLSYQGSGRSSCQRQPVSMGVYSHRIADLANALLTTTLETCGRSWTPRRANTLYGPLNWTVVDSAGLANPPEKRKVGSSILPLTTTHC